jgi:enamine deaminase RidA (YjgF/YER057c/UK114 family)
MEPLMRYLIVPGAPPAPKSARYSHAVEVNGLLFVTGQLPVDPANPDGHLPEGIAAQTEMAILNLGLIVNAAGFELRNTAFARIYLKEFERDYPGMNAVYLKHFSDDSRLPGRTTVGVTKLGRDALIEIDLTVGRG